jgi:hypothetical protein
MLGLVEAIFKSWSQLRNPSAPRNLCKSGAQQAAKTWVEIHHLRPFDDQSLGLTDRVRDPSGICEADVDHSPGFEAEEKLGYSHRSARGKPMNSASLEGLIVIFVQKTRGKRAVQNGVLSRHLEDRETVSGLLPG